MGHEVESGEPQPTAPASGPTTIDLSFQWRWSLLQPRVHRFMAKRFVDEFFDDGSLMLSSFERFATHKDEQRKDASEGTGVRVLTGRDFTAVMASGRGFDCYVLCGSAVNTKAVRDCFPDADGCLIIDNPLHFANAVSPFIPGFKGGCAGQCIYQDDDVIRRHSDALTIEETMPKSLDDLPRLMELSGGVEEMFLKRAQFAAQAEYRMLWGSAAPMLESLPIKCPSARQFCRRA